MSAIPSSRILFATVALPLLSTVRALATDCLWADAMLRPRVAQAIKIRSSAPMAVFLFLRSLALRGLYRRFEIGANPSGCRSRSLAISQNRQNRINRCGAVACRLEYLHTMICLLQSDGHRPRCEIGMPGRSTRNRHMSAGAPYPAVARKRTGCSETRRFVMRTFIAALTLISLIAIPSVTRIANAAPVSPASSAFGGNGY